jgi:hypothetical protein
MGYTCRLMGGAYEYAIKMGLSAMINEMVLKSNEISFVQNYLLNYSSKSMFSPSE